MISFFPSRTVFLEVGDFAVHWYGLMYFFAFLLAYWLLPRLQKHRNLKYSVDEWATLLAWAIVGVIVGGRLGYVLFYEPVYFWNHPLDVVAVWKGGMASHGGFVGVTLALLWATRTKKSDRLSIADTIVVPVALGLMLGRIGNFINQELYGTPTRLPWAIRVPGESLPVHPLQIYGVLKNLLIAGVCFWHVRTFRRAGETAAVFLILYGALRFSLEFIRMQTVPPFEVLGLAITRGQMLTLGIIAAGVVLWVYLKRKK